MIDIQKQKFALVRVALVGVLALVAVVIGLAVTRANAESGPATVQSMQPATLYTFGTNAGGLTGQGTGSGTTSVPTVVSGAAGWLSVSSNEQHSLAIRDDGGLYAWGNNSDARLGLGTTGGSINIPTQVGTDTDWVMVAAGYYHSLALKSDGTLWGWGGNTGGATGLDTTYGSTTAPTQIGTDEDWATIAAGYTLSAAVKADGTLWTWGDNTFYSTGLGTDSGATDIPTRVGSATNWEHVSLGVFHGLAIKTDHTIWSWGHNEDYRTGLGTNSSSTMTPTQIGTASDWTSIEAGISFGYAIKANGTLWSWGDNYFGRNGQGQESGTTNVPTQIGTDSDWLMVSGRIASGLGIKTDHTLWSWGYNDGGRTGLGITDASITLEPTQVGVENRWTFVATGTSSTALLDNRGPYVQTLSPSNFSVVTSWHPSVNWGDSVICYYRYSEADTWHALDCYEDGADIPNPPQGEVPYFATRGVDEFGNIGNESLTVFEYSPPVLDATNDANGDGTLDSDQDNVFVTTSSITGKKVVLVVDEACTIEQVTLETEAEQAGNDAGYKYPHGLLDFAIGCGEEGFETPVILIYYDVDASDLVVRKYNPNTGVYATVQDAVLDQDDVYDQPVTAAFYMVTDGGELDVDGEENGIIIDPVGLAVVSTGDEDEDSGVGADAPNTGLNRQNATGFIIAGIAGALLIAGTFAALYTLRRR